ncbi:hypothetical protein [Flavobacterium sp.]|uniref:hypothetical protein n=1 Tax=Flavobacterium sp. TaxID=239 RepID=UPI0040344978
MKVGLIGENPNDTIGVAQLLLQCHPHYYVPVLKRRTGGQLDNVKFTKLFEIELKTGQFDLLIFVRDLDGFENDAPKMQARQKWFNNHKVLFNGESLYLLNIQTLEAIFFSDIESLNKIFKLKLKFKNPLQIDNPKKELIRLTSEKYKESRSADYMARLDYATVLKNYPPWKVLDDYFKKNR